MIDSVKNNISSRIDGLIFITNQLISTNQTYSDPEVISEVTPTTASEFTEYSYNFNTKPSLQYIAEYKHFFIENCYVLENVKPAYWTIAGVWGVIAFVFTIKLYCSPSMERFSL